MALSRILKIALTGAAFAVQASLMAAPAAELGSDLVHRKQVSTPAPQAQQQPQAGQPSTTRSRLDHEEWKRERKKQHAEWKRERHGHHKHHHGRPDFQRAKFERPQRPERHGHRH